MAKRKYRKQVRKYRRRKEHPNMETLKKLIMEHRGQDSKPAHKVLRDLIRDRRAENLLLKELRVTVRKWRKQPSKLPRDAVARRWAKLLKM